MKKTILAIFALVLTIGIAGNASAQDMKQKNIVETAASVDSYSTLVTAVKAAGLVDTLSAKGPFTVFAPDNTAFAALPDGTVSSLLQPENKDMLTKVLTYHVVAGKYDSKKIMKAIKKGNGKATLTTVSGDTLTAMMEGSNLVLMDEKGGKSVVTSADMKQSNGYIHGINTVLMPE